jgi:hypothetical protein
VKFITREPKAMHLAEQSVNPKLSASDKTPYCRNGGINLRAWELVDLDPAIVHASQVCGSCRHRLRQNDIDIGLADA